MDKVAVEDWMAKYLPWIIILGGAILGVAYKEYTTGVIMFLVACIFDLQFQINKIRRSL
jgi:hypothetical protein